MDFLKAILGDELFGQVKTAIDAHNGAEENKENQIKLGNLGGGEYVGKGKYDALQEMLTGKETELTTANDLIAQLKKDTKGNEELQGKITAYEGQVADLQNQLAETKMKSAVKVALLEAKASDIDYLTYKLNEKLKEKGETLELDDNENIKGWDAQLDGLKTQFPNMFDAGQKKEVEPNKLPEGDGGSGYTKAELLKKSYKERAEIYEKDPEAFNAAMES